jgi:hypothetical protein
VKKKLARYSPLAIGPHPWFFVSVASTGLKARVGSYVRGGKEVMMHAGDEQRRERVNGREAERRMEPFAQNALGKRDLRDANSIPTAPTNHLSYQHVR